MEGQQGVNGCLVKSREGRSGLQPRGLMPQMRSMWGRGGVSGGQGAVWGVGALMRVQHFQQLDGRHSAFTVDGNHELTTPSDQPQPRPVQRLFQGKKKGKKCNICGFFTAGQTLTLNTRGKSRLGRPVMWLQKSVFSSEVGPSEKSPSAGCQIDCL